MLVITRTSHWSHHLIFTSVIWAAGRLCAEAISYAGFLSAEPAQPRSTKDRQAGNQASTASNLGLLGVHRDAGNLRQGEEGKPAGWFGDFSESESTFDVNAMTMYANKPLPKRVVDYGKDPGDFPTVFEGLDQKPAAWYAETPSGGYYDAWQTFYPPPDSTVDHNFRFNEPWRDTPQGWVQDYDYAPTGGSYPHKKPAFWFDSDVLQYDGFGRKNDIASLLDGWQERAVNTSLLCGTPGCQATAMLQLYDSFTEEGKDCRLSLSVHPTDFEDSHSTEIVESVLVNGKDIGSCNPNVAGCNISQQLPLFPCFDGIDISQAVTVSSGGAALIEGKITKYVDECPYEGNLLSAVVTITCMVRMIPPSNPPPGMAAMTVTQPPPAPTNAENQQEMENAFMSAMSDAMNPESAANQSNASNAENPSSPESGSTENSNNPEKVNTTQDLIHPEDPIGIIPIAPYSPELTPTNATNASNPQNSPNVLNLTLPNVPNPLAGTPFANTPDLANNPLFQPLQAALANPLPNSLAALTPPLAGTGNISLQCTEPNCTATASSDVDPLMKTVVNGGGKCLLTVAVNQTDFDSDQGLPEFVEFVKIMGTICAQDVQPGKNPCNEAFAGRPMTDEQKIYTVVSNFDVTSLVTTKDSLEISAKITENVDECSSQGFLLDGLARIDCFAATEAVINAASTNIQR